MIKTSFKLSGAAELNDLLRTLPQSVRAGVLYGILADAGEPMRERMSTLAPRRPPAPDMADHIVMSVAARISTTTPAGRAGNPRRKDNQAAIAIGPEAKFFYGLFLEYGTGDPVPTRPFPFARPAFDATVLEVLEGIRDGIWKAIAEGTT